jgi:hypothetical protein
MSKELLLVTKYIELAPLVISQESSCLHGFLERGFSHINPLQASATTVEKLNTGGSLRPQIALAAMKGHMQTDTPIFRL